MNQRERERERKDRRKDKRRPLMFSRSRNGMGRWCDHELGSWQKRVRNRRKESESTRLQWMEEKLTKWRAREKKKERKKREEEREEEKKKGWRKLNFKERRREKMNRLWTWMSSLSSVLLSSSFSFNSCLLFIQFSYFLLFFFFFPLILPPILVSFEEKIEE